MNILDLTKLFQNSTFCPSKAGENRLSARTWFMLSKSRSGAHTSARHQPVKVGIVQVQPHKRLQLSPKQEIVCSLHVGA